MDIWHYPRTELATLIIDGMSKGLIQRTSIFAPRKRGKTQFIRKDIVPMCTERGILPIYVDFWMDKEDPEAIFIKSVLAAIDKNESLLRKLGKMFSLKKVGLTTAGNKIEVEKDLPSSEPSVDLFTVFQRLNDLDMPVLLLMDEIQHLATRREFEPFTAALRSFVVNREDNNVKCIFTGSSREGLNQLFKNSKAPFYNSSQLMDFAELGADFVEHELNAFSDITGGVELDKEKALKVLISQHRSPSRFIEMLHSMALYKVYDLDEGCARFDNNVIEGVSEHSKLYEQLQPIDIAVFKLIAANAAKGMYSDKGIERVKAFISDNSVSVTKYSIKNALNRLKGHGVVYSPARGEWSVENLDFRDYVMGK